MSELKERRWAVLSERGREESGLSYEEAARLVARLRGERVTGLCVVTDAAAAHIPPPKNAAGRPPKADGGARPRRSRKKKAS
ncbi:MAG TPA: hypothetical protein VF668_20375 [Pyrinomonadaceae bacterium]|jgi:hypothetical protein